YPTETVYGLGVDASSDEPVAKVFKAKNRPLENPISVAVDSIDMARKAIEMTKAAEALFENFLPGPLTIVIKAKPTISELVTARTEKVGVRIPDHPVALKLIESFGKPITSTSANLSGRTPPATAEEALKQLGESVEVALDSGECRIRTPSTVVDATLDRPKILRKGPIAAGEIEKVLRSGSRSVP
ncbi:MAG: L-threonylcarbamoyladenylate synthase, partial [Candidatus Hadarchaeota archaeon]|nr:L-threonylcarbamoyladenylate synthase [Candidatus Hadarchaeota archaeon]